MASVSLSNDAHKRVGIIAGRGDLPLSLAQSLRRRGQTPYLLLIKDEADPGDYVDFPHEVIAITKVGKFLKALKRENCVLVTLAGPVARPDFKNIFPDMEGLKLLTRIGTSLSKGDDGLMRAISSYIEQKGFELVGAHELNDDLLAGAGVMGNVQPTDEDRIDIERGIKIVGKLGSLDIGQAVVIRNEYVLGVEAAEGTEKLIERCGDFSWDYAAGVLVKLTKPGQDIRADMPTIGPDTIRQVMKSGLKGIAVETGRCLIVRKSETIRLANDAGLFVYGASLEIEDDDE